MYSEIYGSFSRSISMATNNYMNWMLVNENSMLKYVEYYYFWKSFVQKLEIMAHVEDL